MPAVTQRRGREWPRRGGACGPAGARGGGSRGKEGRRLSWRWCWTSGGWWSSDQKTRCGRRATRACSQTEVIMKKSSMKMAPKGRMPPMSTLNTPTMYHACRRPRTS
eukprot:2676413-Pleurochrysis_carterae.AAC.1